MRKRRSRIRNANHAFRRERETEAGRRDVRESRADDDDEVRGRHDLLDLRERGALVVAAQRPRVVFRHDTSRGRGHEDRHASRSRHVGERFGRVAAIAGDEEKLAKLLGCGVTQLRRWISGEEPTPPPIYLRALDVVSSGPG